MIESLLGGLLGGVFRLAPEVIKWLDRKSEREHELKMVNAEMQFAKVRSEQEMHAVDAGVSVAQLDALSEALRGQAEMAKAGGQVSSFISALVRPVITVWFTAFYSAVKVAGMLIAYAQQGDWKEVLLTSWGADDMAILSMILSFWFVGRAVEKK